MRFTTTLATGLLLVLTFATRASASHEILDWLSEQLEAEKARLESVEDPDKATRKRMKAVSKVLAVYQHNQTDLEFIAKATEKGFRKLGKVYPDGGPIADAITDTSDMLLNEVALRYRGLAWKVEEGAQFASKKKRRKVISNLDKAKSLLDRAGLPEGAQAASTWPHHDGMRLELIRKAARRLAKAGRLVEDDTPCPGHPLSGAERAWADSTIQDIIVTKVFTHGAASETVPTESFSLNIVLADCSNDTRFGVVLRVNRREGFGDHIGAYNATGEEDADARITIIGPYGVPIDATGTIDITVDSSAVVKGSFAANLWDDVYRITGAFEIRK